jgi:phosphate transport system substrate-binding protein
MLFRTCLLLFTLAAAASAETLTFQGSPIVGQVLNAAALALKDDFGFDLQIATEGGTAGAFLAVGSETAQIGLSTRPIEASDRAQFPASTFDEAMIGWQLLVLGVANDVWESGVRALTREQMVGIYEGDIRNWKQLGGPDEAIKFYNPKRGRGVWELFATWLYNDQRLAPLGDKFETVVSYKDARDSVEFNQGSISVMPLSFADGKAVHALALKERDGTLRWPTRETLVAQKYPLSRPLFVVSGRRFAGNTKRLVDFLLSPRGQGYVESVHFQPVGVAKPPPVKESAKAGASKSAKE